MGIEIRSWEWERINMTKKVIPMHLYNWNECTVIYFEIK